MTSKTSFAEEHRRKQQQRRRQGGDFAHASCVARGKRSTRSAAAKTIRFGNLNRCTYGTGRGSWPQPDEPGKNYTHTHTHIQQQATRRKTETLPVNDVRRIESPHSIRVQPPKESIMRNRPTSTSAVTATAAAATAAVPPPGTTTTKQSQHRHQQAVLRDAASPSSPSSSPARQKAVPSPPPKTDGGGGTGGAAAASTSRDGFRNYKNNKKTQFRFFQNQKKNGNKSRRSGGNVRDGRRQAGAAAAAASAAAAVPAHDAESDTSTTVADTLSMGSIVFAPAHRRDISAITTIDDDEPSATQKVDDEQFYDASEYGGGGSSSCTGPVDVDEMKPIASIEYQPTGPVDVDDGRPVFPTGAVAAEASPASPSRVSGGYDCDTGVEEDGGVSDYDSDEDAIAWSLEDFYIDDDDDSEGFEQQMFGYEDGFEPPVVSDLATPSYEARRKFSEDAIPARINEEGYCNSKQQHHHHHHDRDHNVVELGFGEDEKKGYYV